MLFVPVVQQWTPILPGGLAVAIVSLQTTPKEKRKKNEFDQDQRNQQLQEKKEKNFIHYGLRIMDCSFVAICQRCPVNSLERKTLVRRKSTKNCRKRPARSGS
jgi:hypothetical protein